MGSNQSKWAQMGQKKAQLVTGNDQKKGKIHKNAQLVKMGLNRCRQMDHLKLWLYNKAGKGPIWACKMDLNSLKLVKRQHIGSQKNVIKGPKKDQIQKMLNQIVW